MNKNNKSDCVGNLFEELEELKKVVLDDDSIERGRTYSAGCGEFLTILCC